jgi:hypothetical protein
VLRAVIADVSGIANITDIADIAVETGRHVQGITKMSRDKA